MLPPSADGQMPIASVVMGRPKKKEKRPVKYRLLIDKYQIKLKSF